MALGGAVAFGVAGGAAAYALKAAAPQVAAVNLHNYVAALDDPSILKKEEIDEIANRLVSIARSVGQLSMTMLFVIYLNSKLIISIFFFV